MNIRKRQDIRQTFKNGLALWKGKVYIPKTLGKDWIRKIHEHPTTGHPGIERTVDLIRCLYEVPGLWKTTKEVINECITCHKVKHDKRKPYGKL